MITIDYVCSTEEEKTIQQHKRVIQEILKPTLPEKSVGIKVGLYTDELINGIGGYVICYLGKLTW